MMKPIENMTREELLSLRRDVDAALRDYDARKKKEALAAAQAAVKEHGFTLDEVLGAKKVSRSKAAAKYANPNDPSQTWSGRGRQPVWYKDALAQGKSAEDLAI